MARPSEFTAAPPEKIPLRVAIGKGFSKFIYFISFLFASYDIRPQSPTNFTSKMPKGNISEEQLKLCQHIYDESKNRDEKLTNKANATLSTIAILVPLMLSALAYIRSVTAITPWYHRLSTAVITTSLAFLLLAFIAAFRALFIRGYEALYLNAVIDSDEKGVKPYSVDTHARGLLWCATNNTAMNDQKADFVRASHLFVTISVIMLIVSAAPIIYAPTPEDKTQQVKGTMQITSDSIETLLADIRNEIKATRESSIDRSDFQNRIRLINERMLLIEKEIENMQKRTEED
ncbi:MAG: hypothetical protein ACFE95_20490 [Candidatus Hodarchaeota archaeon]